MHSFEKFQPTKKKNIFCQLCLYLADFNGSLQVTDSGGNPTFFIWFIKFFVLTA